MIEILELSKLDNDKKKYKVVLLDDITGKKKTIKFGQSGADDYTMHNNDEKKRLYIARHKKREDWSKSGIKTAGWWSRYLLWNKKTISASLKDIIDRYGYIAENSE